MDEKHLEQFKRWFDDYVSGFTTDDEFVAANIDLKKEHTRRVCEEMNWLTAALGLSPADRILAETIALFHDIGRFPQVAQYRTFTDAASVNHAQLAVEILDENRILDALDDSEATLIRTAICLHAEKQLPVALERRTDMFARLIRDADKIDIYYVVLRNFAAHKNSPEGLVYELLRPYDQDCSPQIIRSIMNCEPVEYSFAQTLNDIKLLQLGWVFDINFTTSLARIREKRFLLQLLALLPRSPEIIAAGKHVFNYVDRRLEPEQ